MTEKRIPEKTDETSDTGRFWDCLKRVVENDSSTDVPKSTEDLAKKLFRPKGRSGHVFKEKPTSTETRRRSIFQKRLFELDEKRFVEIEVFPQGNDLHLVGFISGLSSPELYLYGDEFIRETKAEMGNFSFPSLKPGMYYLAFVDEGEHYWLPELNLQVSDKLSEEA